MSDYLNKPRTYDSPEVIEDARREIDRRVWTRVVGQGVAGHLQEARAELTAYLSDLDQRNLVSGTIYNYLVAVMEVELENLEEAGKADDEEKAEAIRLRDRPALGMEGAVALDVDESCVRLVQRFQTLDRQLNTLQGAPDADPAMLAAVQAERANVVNLVMFHLGNSFRQCGYLHD